VQHTATHCNTLQHTATHCNTLQHTATLCNTHARRHSFSFLLSRLRLKPYLTATHCGVQCSVLQCVAVCSSVLQCDAVCCSVLQCVAVCYSGVLWGAGGCLLWSWSLPGIHFLHACYRVIRLEAVAWHAYNVSESALCLREARRGTFICVRWLTNNYLSINVKPMSKLKRDWNLTETWLKRDSRITTYQSWLTNDFLSKASRWLIGTYCMFQFI